MCRNIHTLYNYEPEASGTRSARPRFSTSARSAKPSQANAEAFERAVDEVAAASSRLLAGLVVRPAEEP